MSCMKKANKTRKNTILKNQEVKKMFEADVFTNLFSEYEWYLKQLILSSES